MISSILSNDILGVHISITSYRQTLAVIEQFIKAKRKGYICICAVNQVMQCYKNPTLLDGVNKAILRLPDGMPLVWLSRLAGYSQVERVYGVTLTEQLCRFSIKKRWKIFLLGGARGQSQELADLLRNHYSSICIVGNIDTPAKEVSDKHNKKILDQLRLTKPDIVLVGMGCPYQEYWMIQNRSKTGASVLIGVGAVFDYLTGRIYKTPEWVKKFGLEWLFRFVQEPRRLWYRYTVQNLNFIFLILWKKLDKASEQFF